MMYAFLVVLALAFACALPGGILAAFCAVAPGARLRCRPDLSMDDVRWEQWPAAGAHGAGHAHDPRDAAGDVFPGRGESPVKCTWLILAGFAGLEGRPAKASAIWEAA